MTKEQYVEAIDKDFKSLPENVRKSYQKPTRSQVVERSMRFGREARSWDLKDHSEIEYYAEWSLKDDFVQEALKQSNGTA